MRSNGAQVAQFVKLFMGTCDKPLECQEADDNACPSNKKSEAKRGSTGDDPFGDSHLHSLIGPACRIVAGCLSVTAELQTLQKASARAITSVHSGHDYTLPGVGV